MRRLPNVTRESPSIPRRLLREGKPHLIPVYALMLTSDLGREGIERSGSFRFADHVYRNVPGGRFGIGWLLDAALLRLPAARSMRSRYVHSRDVIVAEVRARAAAGARDVRIVSAPCGIAREMVDAADAIDRDTALSAVRVHFHGIDLDPEPLALSRELAGARPDFTFASGDAFDPAAYPPATDVIVSTGLVDFLDDESAIRFFTACHAALRAGGVLVTSSQQPQALADYLMRELAELRPVYRGPAQITDVVRAAGFTDVSARADAVGLQTLVTARKAGTP
ncbi:MAG TPA: class I SAM-dependent methyltransferase family protein [Gemmatimonadaceae bacterium]|nr:class I SAM-dependent methyltransferase family protein [Gemmatimonadaceae bacterium]